MTIKLIVIGASLGGVKALSSLFSMLPRDFTVPIAVVIHRAPVEFDYLVEILQKSTSIKVQEALNKLPIQPATITIAPADYHLLIDEQYYALSIDIAVQYARPSINVLMGSASDAFGLDVVGVILTGGGNDGVQGAEIIKKNGGTVLVQSPKTCADPNLPNAIIESEIVSDSFSITDLAKLLSVMN